MFPSEKYRKLYSIYTFDLTHYNEEISSQIVTMVLHMQFKTALAKADALLCFNGIYSVLLILSRSYF